MFNLLLFPIFKVEKWKSDMMKLVYNHNYGIVFWILLQNENDINCGSGRIDID